MKIVICRWMCHCFLLYLLNVSKIIKKAHSAGGLASTSDRRLSLGSPFGGVGTLGATSQDSPGFAKDDPQVLRDSPSKVVGDSCYPRLSLR